jgi:hypothetical protein
MKVVVRVELITDRGEVNSPPCKIRFRSRMLPNGRSGAVVLSDPQPVVRGTSKACCKTLGRQRSHARTKNTGASPSRLLNLVPV